MVSYWYRYLKNNWVRKFVKVWRELCSMDLLIGRKTKNWPKNVSGWKLYWKQFFKLSDEKRANFLQVRNPRRSIHHVKIAVGQFSKLEALLHFTLPLYHTGVTAHARLNSNGLRARSQIFQDDGWRHAFSPRGQLFKTLEEGVHVKLERIQRKNKKCDEGKMHSIKVNTKLLRIRWYLL